MEFALPMVQNLLAQIGSYVKIFVETVTPFIKNVWNALVPIFIAVFTFLASIDYYGIITSKPFIFFMSTLILSFLVYAYLSMYKPDLLRKIKDFLTLVPVRKRRDVFVFKSSMDLSVESI